MLAASGETYVFSGTLFRFLAFAGLFDFCLRRGLLLEIIMSVGLLDSAIERWCSPKIVATRTFFDRFETAVVWLIKRLSPRG